jgi:arylformamidase
MTVRFEIDRVTYSAQLDAGIDLSIPVKEGPQVNAYFAAPADMEPFRMGDWVGEVRQGGSVNYRNIRFNPHGNGTHTECVGHISPEIHSINRHFRQFHCVAQLVSVVPEERGDDHVITAGLLREQGLQAGTDAFIIRTLPNAPAKRTHGYSGTNPPYFTEDAILLLRECGCRHLLTDLPSLDREEDGGLLAGHRAFWDYPDAPRMHCTVTELIFVPDVAQDGLYLLNLQVAPFENDAAPSRPVIFPLHADSAATKNPGQ